MKKLVFFILFNLLILFSNPLSAVEDHTLFPIPLRIAGIGEIFGLGYTSKNLFVQDDRLAIATTSGNVNSYGVFYGDLKPFDSNIKFNLAFGNISDYNLRAFYSRGFEESQFYNVRGEISTFLFSIQYESEEKLLQTSLSASLITTKFREFRNKDNVPLDIPNFVFTDLKQASTQFRVQFNFVDDVIYPKNGIVFGTDQINNGVSSGYSGSAVSNLYLSLYFGIFDTLLFTTRYFQSDAQATIKKVDTQDGVKEIVNANCDLSQNKDECNHFIESITSFIARHNQKGTANFLGGPAMLRSYSLARFRAAHTRYATAEVKLFLSDFDTELVYFQEMGRANDELQFIDQETITSTGGEARFQVANSEYRMGYAHSKNSNEWYATFGKAF